MKKIICDRCGKDAKEGATLSSEDKVWDLCEDCDNDYDAFWTEMLAGQDRKIKAWLEEK